MGIRSDNLYLLKYLGIKMRMARILSNFTLGHCTTYADLYCGSSVLALDSRNSKVGILNDYNPHIANF